MTISMIIALVLFILTYTLLLLLPKYRSYVAFVSAIVFSIWLSIDSSVNWKFSDIINAIDFNVLLMIFGTMGIVIMFIDSKMPMKIADFLLSKLKNVKLAIVALAALAGIVSAFIDNVATVLMIAPIALAICKKQDISPVSAIIAIAISSNLQGAATLVGDTTSILLGGYAGMNFLDFFFFKGKMSIFWAVEIGALLTIFVLLYIFRKETQPLTLSEQTKVNDYVPSILLLSIIVLLIGASFIPKPSNDTLLTIYELRNGLICVGLLFVGIIIYLIKNKNIKMCLKVAKEIDYQTILLLASLFIIIKGISDAGIIDKIADLLVQVGSNGLFILYTVIVFASVLVSAFVDNIPYVLTMLPIIQRLSITMNIQPEVLYFGLLIGATLGGNITPIGASANITGIGILRKEGYEVKAKDFMKLSIPLTFTAVLSGYIFIWLFWGL